MLERWSKPLCGLSNAIAKLMDAIFRPLGRPGKLLQDFLNGSWLGHSVHPVVTDVAVGGATAALLLQVLIWFGVTDLEVALIWLLGLTWLSGLSAIVTGLTDFKDTATGDERNVVGLHGEINIVATVLFIAAFVAAVTGASGA